MPFDFEEMFTKIVCDFIKNKAVSVSSSIGYFVPYSGSEDMIVKGLSQIVWEMREEHLAKRMYLLCQWKCLKIVDYTLEGKFIEGPNNAVKERVPGPKSKKADLLKRVAAC